MMVKSIDNKLRFTATLLLCVLLQACGEPPTPPEEAIREWVATGQQLAEDKDRRSLMDMISPSYTDGRGNKQADIENMFRLYFRRQSNIKLLTKIKY